MKSTVDIFMNPNPIFVDKETSLQSLMDNMMKAHLTHVLVVENVDKLLGVVSREDLLKSLTEILKEITRGCAALRIVRSRHS